jgi:hypothetical protein
MIREESKKAEWRKSKSDNRLEDLVSSYCPNDVCSNSNSNGISNSINNDQDKLSKVLEEHRKRGVKVEDELRKMKAWLATRQGRRMTLRFIVNWLNKCEGTVEVKIKPKVTKSSCESDPAWKRLGFKDRYAWQDAGSPYE